MRSAPFICPLRGRTTCEAGQVGASLADTASQPRAEAAELMGRGAERPGLARNV